MINQFTKKNMDMYSRIQLTKVHCKGYEHFFEFIYSKKPRIKADISFILRVIRDIDKDINLCTKSITTIENDQKTYSRYDQEYLGEFRELLTILTKYSNRAWKSYKIFTKNIHGENQEE